MKFPSIAMILWTAVLIVAVMIVVDVWKVMHTMTTTEMQ